jgi:hypothetical protein
MPRWRRSLEAIFPNTDTRCSSGMSAGFIGKVLLITACATLLGTTCPLARTSASDPSEIVLSAARRACSESMNASPASQAKLVSEDLVRARGVNGLKHVWQLSDGNELRITQLRRLDRGGTLFFVDFYEATSATPRALMRVVMSAQCRVLGGRKIVYGPTDGKGEGPLSVARLDSRLNEYGDPLPLNPEIPSGGSRHDCVRVALLDNGVNYLLPEIATALARDEQGKIIGYDFWEEDRRPFDYGAPQTNDPRISLFSPRHHGTMVASIFIREASSAPVCLAAYRYLPSDDQNKIGRIIAEMAKDGIRIVNISSERSRPWPEFLTAIKEHPDLLFVVSAGNGGADLNNQPFYPASYAAENTIVVAATDSRVGYGNAAIGEWASWM